MSKIDYLTRDTQPMGAILQAFYVGPLSDLETIEDDAPTVPGLLPCFEDTQDDLPLPFVEIEIFEVLEQLP